MVEVMSPEVEFDDYWQYEVVPTLGEVRSLETGRVKYPRPATMHPRVRMTCWKELQVPSPDGQARLICRENNRGTDQLEVIAHGRTPFVWPPGERRMVQALAWSEDSRFLAILNASSARRGGLLDMMLGGAGHPIWMHTAYLDLVEISSSTVYEYRLQGDLFDVVGQIVSWASS